jgi:hypothetical protein
MYAPPDAVRPKRFPDLSSYRPEGSRPSEQLARGVDLEYISRERVFPNASRDSVKYAPRRIEYYAVEWVTAVVIVKKKTLDFATLGHSHHFSIAVKKAVVIPSQPYCCVHVARWINADWAGP